MNTLPVYDDKYIQTKKIRTCGDKVYPNCCGLNVPEDDIESEPFTAISIDSILVYESKNYLQVYLNNCTYKIVDKQIINYLVDNHFETDED